MIGKLLAERAAALGIAVSPAQAEQFARYHAMLVEANARMNLTRVPDDPIEAVDRNYLDCIAVLAGDFPAAATAIDVGSGAGFPGLALKVAEPSLSLTLLDSLDKRVRFLQELSGKLGFEDVVCLHARAEEAPEALRGQFDVAASRAVARLNLLCELCLPFVKVGGLFLAMKGPGAEEEAEEAAKAIALLGGKLERVAVYPIPGTDTRHSVVMIRKVRETPKKYPRRWAQIKKQPL